MRIPAPLRNPVEVLPPLAAVVSALGLYLATLAPSITWRGFSQDSADFATAVAVLGIPHPTGYPAYVLLAHLFGRLVPWGEWAHRTNLFSAVSAGASVLAVYHLIGLWRPRQGVGPWPYNLLRAGVALAWACTPLLWSQAVVTEVYALHTALAGWLWALASRWVLRGDRRALVAAGLVGGLGLGVHLTLLFALGGAGLWILLARRPPLRLVLPAAGAFAAGLLVYLYIPLRALQDPPLVWGDPRDWPGFWWLVSGALYRGYVFGVEPAHWPQRIASSASLLLEQVTPLGLILVGVGLVRLLLERWALVASLALYGLVLGFYAITYNTTDSFVYFLPLFLLAMAVGGVGLASVLEWAFHPGLRAVAVALAGALALLLAVPGFPRHNLRGDTTARDWALQTLGAMEGPGVAFFFGDPAMSLWYAAYVVTPQREQVVPLPGTLMHNPFVWRRLVRLHSEWVADPSALGLLDRVVSMARASPHAYLVQRSPSGEEVPVQQGTLVVLGGRKGEEDLQELARAPGCTVSSVPGVAWLFRLTCE